MVALEGAHHGQWDPQVRRDKRQSPDGPVGETVNLSLDRYICKRRLNAIRGGMTTQANDCLDLRSLTGPERRHQAIRAKNDGEWVGAACLLHPMGSVVQ